ncbi:hypothetical protein OsI_18176 [Oryza sativa Indica Group]|uniref:Uncharacterized protein n=1 Tax=Oryza sativa subsp. indica TaxID=39946 RepID=B8AXC8_ORYSI|nr:hypothetical protein OsI_18176 [Oryza sativa Indica Group]
MESWRLDLELGRAERYSMEIGDCRTGEVEMVPPLAGAGLPCARAAVLVQQFVAAAATEVSITSVIWLFIATDYRLYNDLY